LSFYVYLPVHLSNILFWVNACIPSLPFDEDTMTDVTEGIFYRPSSCNSHSEV